MLQASPILIWCREMLAVIGSLGWAEHVQVGLGTQVMETCLVGCWASRALTLHSPKHRKRKIGKPGTLPSSPRIAEPRLESRKWGSREADTMPAGHMMHMDEHMMLQAAPTVFLRCLVWPWKVFLRAEVLDLALGLLSLHLAMVSSATCAHVQHFVRWPENRK